MIGGKVGWNFHLIIVTIMILKKLTFNSRFAIMITQSN